MQSAAMSAETNSSIYQNTTRKQGLLRGMKTAKRTTKHLGLKKTRENSFSQSIKKSLPKPITLNQLVQHPEVGMDGILICDVCLMGFLNLYAKHVTRLKRLLKGKL